MIIVSKFWFPFVVSIKKRSLFLYVDLYLETLLNFLISTRSFSCGCLRIFLIDIMSSINRDSYISFQSDCLLFLLPLLWWLGLPVV